MHGKVGEIKLRCIDIFYALYDAYYSKTTINNRGSQVISHNIHGILLMHFKKLIKVSSN
jgi:hypothetical protein